MKNIILEIFVTTMQIMFTLTKTYANQTQILVLAHWCVARDICLNIHFWPEPNTANTAHVEGRWLRWKNLHLET